MSFLPNGSQATHGLPATSRRVRGALRRTLGTLVLLVAGCGEEESLATAPAGDGGAVCTSCGDCDEAVAVTGGVHVDDPIDYPDLPPAGGDHASCWAPWGAHEDEVPDDRWVHNLEHGGVVLLYRCATPDCAAEAADLAELRALVESSPQLLLTPSAELPTRFAAVAWGRRLRSDCLDPEAARRFYESHANGPGAPEPGIAAGPPSGC
ncbi:MAG: DUF3105 domain-containing protein [Deltaproteobacteria bacterium]|nr:DUF3105 domain-containing protein [Deltaproteobacteria bacterium]